MGAFLAASVLDVLGFDLRSVEVPYALELTFKYPTDKPVVGFPFNLSAAWPVTGDRVGGYAHVLKVIKW